VAKSIVNLTIKIIFLIKLITYIIIFWRPKELGRSFNTEAGGRGAELI
jgi:hypothetical protein